MYRWVLALLAFTAACSTSDSSLDDVVADWQQESGVSSVSVTVLAPDGDVHWNTGEGLYQVGSLTKTVVAATSSSGVVSDRNAVRSDSSGSGSSPPSRSPAV